MIWTYEHKLWEILIIMWALPTKVTDKVHSIKSGKETSTTNKNYFGFGKSNNKDEI